jgi:DNA modification methylase
MNWEELRQKLIDSKYYYFHTDNGVLLCGNCFEVLKELPDNSIGLTLTSPPFIEDEVEGEYYGWLGNFLDLVKKKTNVLLMFNSSLRLVEICKRWEWRHVLIWHKPFTLPAYKYEPIFLWTKNRNQKIWGRGRIYRNVLSYNVPRKKVHINENPVELYEELIRFFKNEHTIVLDPFLGSGTTAIAAEKSGKRWIGIEINKDYCKIAKERILKEVTKHV